MTLSPVQEERLDSDDLFEMRRTLNVNKLTRLSVRLTARTLVKMLMIWAGFQIVRRMLKVVWFSVIAKRND